MINILKTIYHKLVPRTIHKQILILKTIVCNFSFKRRKDYRSFRKKKAFGDHAEKVLIDIYSMEGLCRVPLQIVKQMIYCGYDCYTNVDFFYYLRMNEYAKSILFFDKVYYCKKGSKNKDFSIIISGNKDFLNKFNDSTKIFFNLDVFTDFDKITKQDFFYPLLLHPNLFKPALEQEIYLNTVRDLKSERKIAALFCGNVQNVLALKNIDNILYNRNDTKHNYNINTRIELFLYIYNELRDCVYIPESFDVLIEKMETNQLKNKIVLIDTNQTSIPQEKLFDILKETDFYIYMPGMLQPYCHNHIESMLAGCIPITQLSRFYPEVFKHSCLSFEHLEELKAILQNVCAGYYRNQLPGMRQELMKLYWENISFESFRIKLSEHIENGAKRLNYFMPPDWIPEKLKHQAS